MYIILLKNLNYYISKFTRKPHEPENSNFDKTLYKYKRRRANRQIKKFSVAGQKRFLGYNHLSYVKRLFIFLDTS